MTIYMVMRVMMWFTAVTVMTPSMARMEMIRSTAMPVMTCLYSATFLVTPMSMAVQGTGRMSLSSIWAVVLVRREGIGPWKLMGKWSMVRVTIMGRSIPAVHREPSIPMMAISILTI